VVPHGIVFNETYVWEAERRAPLPAVLTYSDYRARAYERLTDKLPIRSAVPFAYLLKLLDGVSPGARAGTLFFPSHSSHRVTAEADFSGMAEVLTDLEAKYQPVTVCIYWRDYELGRHVPFLECGLRVVSAGHIFDPAFLFRLFHLCQSHYYAASNHIGSSLLYSALAGCRCFLLPQFSMTHTGTRESLDSDVSRGGEVQEALAEAFAEPAEVVTPHQYELVSRICGLDHLLTADELRSLLLMADRLDRFGVARDPRNRRLRFVLPPSHMRTARSIVQQGRRRLRVLRSRVRTHS
jgi:hypothetical protein